MRSAAAFANRSGTGDPELVRMLHDHTRAIVVAALDRAEREGREAALAWFDGAAATHVALAAARSSPRQ